VETAELFETYSNGLRIENLYRVSHRPRSWRPMPLRPGGSRAEPRADPAGIVFHATESHMVAFEPERTRALAVAGRQLLDYVRERRSYHFVIDRFGRVHRVVQETDAANHAGWSVWADDRWIYINLNDSFLAVAFEARYEGPGGTPVVNPAQVRAGRALTEMLRSRYHIAAVNCVTHAQVSVNPDNFRVGYHTDWAHSLPFGDLGLPDNYARPVPSLILFGFGYDPALADSARRGMWAGLHAAETLVESEAAFREMPPARYRAILRQRFRETTTALENPGAGKESKP
jgi:N-acetylmuramoyl-L-alanine amidase-like protein